MTQFRPPSEPPVQLDDRPRDIEIAAPSPGAVRERVLASSPTEEVAGHLVGVAPVDAMAMLFADPDTGGVHLVFVSDGLASMLDRRPDELLGQSPSAIFGPGGMDRFREATADLGIKIGLRRSGAANGSRRSNSSGGDDESNGGNEPNGASEPIASSGGDAEPTVEADGATSGEISVSIFGEPTGEQPAQPPAGERRSGRPSNVPEAEPWRALNKLGTPDEPADAQLGLAPRSGAPARPGTPLRPGEPARPGMPPHPADAPAAIDLNADHGQAGPERGAADRAGFHVDEPLAAGERRVHTAIQQLVKPSGRRIPMHVTYTTVPSMIPTAPYVVLEFRDLEQPASERLLADQTTVMASLSRGHELGRLCHQVASQLERDLDDGSRCWMSISDPNGNLEPVLAGDLPFDTVAHVMAELGSLGPATSRRLVSVEVLSGSVSAMLRGRGVRTLWYLPLITGNGNSERISGAVVVVTPRERPDRAAVRSLDNLVSVMQVAIEQATAKAAIAHQTLHDPLTGLPNRALLVDRLNQAMARLERDGIAMSVLLVDIDQFKSVNDSHGAAVGDKVLLEVAARLLGVLRLGDTVGRLSNDQFLVMCASGKGELDPAAVGRRILRGLAEPLSLGSGDDLRITASVGVVVVDQPGPTPEAVISNAESALAAATAKGRGCMAFYKADLQRYSVQRHQTEQALHRAIAQDEFLVHYQPLVEIKTGFMVGAEALVRWDRPGHGVLGPIEFIPLAEESDLIVDLGRWVLDRVCKDLREWPRSRGRAPMVTVNLGARQVISDSLVPMVEELLERHELPTSQIGFEITESMEIQNAEEAVVNLTKLKELGCRIAIDDFGIGYATLEYIRRFSMADALKIDKSFVAGLGHSQEDTAIVNASIALASSLGLQVVAEGVENSEQLRALRDLGARYAQGFGLARPMAFDAVLDRWRHAQLYQPTWDEE